MIYHLIALFVPSSIIYAINKNLNPEKNSTSKQANPFMRYIALVYMSNPQSPKGAVPNVVALEVLRKNGIDIDKLIKLITAGVGAEFTTYYYYTILRMHCTGLEGEGIKEIVEDARTYDIAQRIMQEEVEHEAWFIELLSKRPSGHFRRKFAGQSPHTGNQGSLIHL